MECPWTKAYKALHWQIVALAQRINSTVKQAWLPYAHAGAWWGQKKGAEKMSRPFVFFNSRATYCQSPLQS